MSCFQIQANANSHIQNKFIALHRAESSLLDVVMSVDFTSQMCALTQTSILCFHIGLLKRNYSVCRKANMSPSRIAVEQRTGLLVGADARDFPDSLQGTGLECKLNCFRLNANEDLCWTAKWSFNPAYRNAHDIFNRRLVWCNGFTCRNNGCIRHRRCSDYTLTHQDDCVSKDSLTSDEEKDSDEEGSIHLTKVIGF